MVATLTAMVATLTAMVATLTAMVATLTAMVATLTAMVATLTAAAEAAADATMAAAVPVDRQQDALNVHAVADQNPDLPAPFPRRDVPRRAPVGVRRGRHVSGR